jgi:hypothetical protein
MGSVVVLLEDWARKWLRRMLLTSGPFSLKKHKTNQNHRKYNLRNHEMHCTFPTRVPESVLKGDDDDALEELGASLAGVIHEHPEKLVASCMVLGRTRDSF